MADESQPGKAAESLADEPGDQQRAAAPLPAEEVDTLDALAFALGEASPQEAVYRRVDLEVRAGAALFDGVLFGGASLILLMLFHGFRLEELVAGALHLAAYQFNGASIVLFGFLWLLYTSTEVFFNATPAKFLISIHIGTTNFGPSTRRQRLIRWILRRSAEVLWVSAISMTIATEFGFIRLPMSDVIRAMLWLGTAAQIWVIVAFGFAGTSRKLALYDAMTQTAVIQDIDAKPSKDAAFEIVNSDTN